MPSPTRTGDATWQPSVYLGLEPDGRVIIIAHRSEMGTGIRTSLPMVVADELEADWKRVTVQQALGDKKYGDQNTDGSNSIRSFYQPMRIAGATARTMLESAAAIEMGRSCFANATRRITRSSTPSRTAKLGFGELVALAAQQPVPKKEDLKFKSPSEYRYIGKDVPIVDLDAITEGRATFGMDARMPGMVYASIERSPVIGGTLKSVDDAEARKVRGVSQTVTIAPFNRALGISTAGRSGGDRRQYLGRDAGPQETQSRLGSGRERRLRFRRLQKHLAGHRAQNLQTGAERWRRGCGLRQGCKNRWRPNTTCRIWRTPPWNRPPLSPNSKTAR